MVTDTAQTEFVNNGNERVFHTSKSSRTGTSTADSLLSCPGEVCICVCVCVISIYLHCTVGWDRRIHRLLLCRGLRSRNEYPGYDSKQPDLPSRLGL